MDDTMKRHLTYGTGIVILGFFTLLLYSIVLYVFLGALEALSRGDLDYFGGYSLYSGMYAIIATLVGLWLRQTINEWLSYRIPKIPEVCRECKKELHFHEVKWTGIYESAECPHCGVELEVTRVWP